SDMSEIFETGEQKQDDTPKSKEEIKEKIDRLKPNAINRLLLVRFMDFTVEPGHSYIYRVRVALQNPYLGRPVDDLEQPEQAMLPVLMSDWSPATPEVYVPQSYRYYVQETMIRPGMPNEAEVSMYYEHPEAGMPVMADMKVPVGCRIGGERDTDVINLSTSSLDTEAVEFNSNDVLISIDEGRRLLAGDVPDLAGMLKGLPRGQKPIPDRITVIDSAGNLVSRTAGDSVYAGTGMKTYDEDKANVALLIKKYEEMGYRKGDATADANVFNFGGDAEGGMSMSMPGYGLSEGNPLSQQKKGGRRQGASSRRRQSQMGGSDMGGYDGF
ncbi:MAG: hypothetical protein KDA85_21215, partial [Planctomycetaceae bacterium]|nr:hypothetical protein [Planctomycetaceae bacterium]